MNPMISIDYPFYKSFICDSLRLFNYCLNSLVNDSFSLLATTGKLGLLEYYT